MIKNILIPAALFALTATGVHAYSGDYLQKLTIDLTVTEIRALEKADELRTSAHEAAQQVLLDAGITRDRMREIQGALHDARRASRDAVQKALLGQDYAAFKKAVVGSPLESKIDTEAKFNQFLEAQALIKSGDRESGREIMTELGIAGKGHGMGMGRGHRGDMDGIEGK